MCDCLNAALLQTSPVWEDVIENLERIRNVFRNIPNDTDLVILPEMFTTGFTMTPHHIAPECKTLAINCLKELSARYSVSITGSIAVEDNGRYYNRLVWVDPNNGIYFYDKRHLFRMADEHRVFSPGIRHLTIDLKGWKIRPFICYDLRFPLWTRNFENQYDIAVFVANWPEKRRGHWQVLLRARAIENQCYVIGVNRTGMDGNRISYCGDSMVIDPRGEILLQAAHHEGVHTVSLDYNLLNQYRTDFPVWKDADIIDLNF